MKVSWAGSAIFRRIVLAIFAVSLIPLVIFGLLTWRAGIDARTESVDRGREVLYAQAAEALELRAIETAEAAAALLERAESDLYTLALLPRANSSYLDFYNARSREIWTVMDGEEVFLDLPLYREVTFVGVEGVEEVKITDGQVATSRELFDVSDTSNTTYKSEIYFPEARWLEPGQIYVGHVNGFYVTGEQAAEGETFEGVIRFAMPVFNEVGRFDGMVVLALDSRHLSELTAHIVPTEERYVVEPDLESNNFAFMVDDYAFFIAYPDPTYLRGLDPDGLFLPVAQSSADIGVYPVRIDLLGFMDEDLASIPRWTREGQSGSLQYEWSGITKFVAYAPIPYYGGEYAEPAGFGWVGIGADLSIFHESAGLVGEVIRATVADIGQVALILGGATLVAVLTVAALLARNISDPVQRITEASRSVDAGEFDLKMLKPLLKRSASDDFAQMARVFKEMAEHVKKREQYYRLLDAVVSIGVALPQEKDFNRLLERVVLEAKELCYADSGTLYLTEDSHLNFMIVRNDKLGLAQGGTSGVDVDFKPIPLFNNDGEPNHNNVATHTVHTKEITNVPDAYESTEFDFTGTRKFDEQSGYRSKSFLAVPLMDNDDDVIGVLQLINAQDPTTHDVIAFDPGLNRVIESLAALGTVAVQAYMREARLREKIAQLQIHIDEVRKQEEVEQITESEYFQELQERAREIRSRKRK